MPDLKNTCLWYFFINVYGPILDLLNIFLFKLFFYNKKSTFNKNHQCNSRVHTAKPPEQKGVTIESGNRELPPPPPAPWGLFGPGSMLLHLSVYTIEVNFLPLWLYLYWCMELETLYSVFDVMLDSPNMTLDQH